VLLHFVLIKIKPTGENVFVGYRAHVHVCICVRTRVHVVVGERGGRGYILVMLTEFYKLWLTPLPTAD